MEVVTIVVLLAVAGGLVAFSLMPRTGEQREQLKRRIEGRNSFNEIDVIKQKAKESAAEKLVKKASPMLSRIIMPVSDEEQSQLRLKLTQAGYRSRQATTMFLAAKTAVLVLGVVGGVGMGVLMGLSMKAMLAACLLTGGVGFIAPGVWLGSVTGRRQTKIRRGLPDVLDLLVVSVESGLALDAAIKRVGEEMAIVHPDLSEEFRMATMESQMGIPRAEAMENMAIRVGIEELRSLVSVIAQAERFGTSVSKALRNQGEAMRTKRRQKAEEKAQQTAVKLMIPLVLFIFPAMGVVLAGPAAINLMEAFSK